MSTVSAAASKITYSSAHADMTAFHRSFDQALTLVRGKAGREHPLWIDGKAVKSPSPPIVDLSPIDTSFILGKFSAATAEHVDLAVKAARREQKKWASLSWKERVETMRRASQAIRERKYEIAAVMSLEVGKSRMEAMGDAEESADLIDYYAKNVEDNDGYVVPLGKLLPNEKTCSVLRPFGVFVCIAPYNFPMALSTGMSAAALLAGNGVVYKPAQDTPWTGLMLYECYMAAGVPAGLFNYVTGLGSAIGDALWKNPGVDGIVFTGSKEVGMRMVKEFSSAYPKPALMELGGKNPTYVSETARLDDAAQGVMRSAFGLQGQKCSACSRVYVHEQVYDAFLAELLKNTRAIKCGDPTQKDVFFGPVINGKAIKTFEAAIESAKNGGKILIGGERLRGGIFDQGHFCAPTIVELPLDHEIFMRELFVPILAIGKVKNMDQAIEESNKAEYGLTAGIFTAKKEEIQKYFDEIESGVCYANRPTGATTGAWPGVQSFCGWKGSGSTGKGGCGPYYVTQFMREQSRTIME
ncbi:MAG TPA: 1-pyrroline-5-carboxylate dehydrogenase [Elusimicrobia bacterium]|nr:MAG: 1-pyrroline-5-carboxylate dehydrogenase [Elusimicrobia bacterium GWA2_66_18]OGR69473.1 MAG: 1-pyrroline-5-carboxylate dehydrogenase [Elusimicrobia bacterium GWC2_65_9]HAZ09169.1 1-pyrroline-5-carboxylate dehydrogenase [Elusimicrobiota bacterium]